VPIELIFEEQALLRERPAARREGATPVVFGRRRVDVVLT
jgi:hypothetical protein